MLFLRKKNVYILALVNKFIIEFSLIIKQLKEKKKNLGGLSFSKDITLM